MTRPTTLLAGAFLATMAVSAQAQQASDELPLVRDIPPSEGVDPAPDILGIQFGDSLETALSKLREAYPGIEPVTTKVRTGIRDQHGNQVTITYPQKVALNTPYGQATTEAVSLYLTTPATGGRVYGIRREILYDASSYASMDDVRKAVADKYGEPTLVELYPHQNRDEINFTWENRPIKRMGVHDVSKEGFMWNPDNSNRCLGAYSISKDPYGFKEPGRRKPNPGWEACVAGLRVSLSYGANEKTVRHVIVEATDFVRWMADGQLADEAFQTLIDNRANAVTGKGAPKL